MRLSPRMLVLAAVVLALVLYLVLSRWVQRCPHCGAFTPRARRGWHRCRRCRRQYHRSVRHISGR